MHADRIGSHFSHNGPINFQSQPDCYICKDASVDTHIDATYVRHLSSLTSDIICIIAELFLNAGHPTVHFTLCLCNSPGQIRCFHCAGKSTQVPGVICKASPELILAICVHKFTFTFVKISEVFIYRSERKENI